MTDGPTDTTAEPVSSKDPTGRQHRFRATVVSFGSLAVLDIGASIVLFTVATDHGASETAAYLIASIGPLLGMAFGYLRTRKLGGVSLIILTFTLLSAVVALVGGGGGRVLLLKDAAVTGGFGLVTLASMITIFPKPLMFFFGLKFGTDGSQEGTDRWYGMWDAYPAFRRSQYVINTVWGVSYLLEAALKVVLVYTAPYETAYIVNQVAPFVVLAIVIGWTIWYGNQTRKAGEARRAALAATGDAQPVVPAE